MRSLATDALNTANREPVPVPHRNVRCCHCHAVQWVAMNIGAIACERCGEMIRLRVAI